MLKNTLQILVTLALLSATVCPCFAQSLVAEDDAHHEHTGAQHHDAAEPLPECHGGEGASKCASVAAGMGEVANFLVGSHFEPDDDTADIVARAIEQPDLTHHGGSPPSTKTLVAGSPVTLHDRLIE